MGMRPLRLMGIRPLRLMESDASYSLTLNVMLYLLLTDGRTYSFVRWAKVVLELSSFETMLAVRNQCLFFEKCAAVMTPKIT